MTTGRDEEVPTRGLADPDAMARSIDELEAIRRRVINVVGHVLRTPVTTISGMASALATAQDETTRTTLVEGLARNARRVEQLLDDLLIAAGVSTALPVGDPNSTSIGVAFDAAWNALGGRGDLVVSGIERAASARPGVVERLAFAILDNALRYGRGPISVTTSTTASGVRIEIESVGDVPTDEELGHAFEPLYRGEHAVMSGPGLGLGLSVARELARAEGGDVGLERRGDAIVATVDLPT